MIVPPFGEEKPSRRDCLNGGVTQRHVVDGACAVVDDRQIAG